MVWVSSAYELEHGRRRLGIVLEEPLSPVQEESEHELEGETLVVAEELDEREGDERHDLFVGEDWAVVSQTGQDPS